jgi:hypothetical protein
MKLFSKTAHDAGGASARNTGSRSSPNRSIVGRAHRRGASLPRLTVLQDSANAPNVSPSLVYPVSSQLNQGEGLGGHSLDAPLVLVVPHAKASQAPLSQSRRPSSVHIGGAELDDAAVVFEGGRTQERSSVWASASDSDEVSSDASDSEKNQAENAGRSNRANGAKTLPPGTATLPAAAATWGLSLKTQHLTNIGRFIKGRLAILLKWIWFDRIMLCMIFASCVFLALDAPDLDPDSQLGQAQVRCVTSSPTRECHC